MFSEFFASKRAQSQGARGIDVDLPAVCIRGPCAEVEFILIEILSWWVVLSVVWIGQF